MNPREALWQAARNLAASPRPLSDEARAREEAEFLAAGDGTVTVRDGYVTLPVRAFLDLVDDRDTCDDQWSGGHDRNETVRAETFEEAAEICWRVFRSCALTAREARGRR